MKNRLFFVGVFSCLLIAVLFANPLDANEGVKRIANNSIVYIEAEDINGKGWSGTGFFITSSLVATNYHVVHNARMVAGIGHGTGRKFYFLGATEIDTARDLAILKVSTDSHGSPLHIGSGVSKGQTVYAAGYPHGKYKFSKGKVTNVNGGKSCEDQEFKISRNMIKFGNSGGPILNNDGQVVGVAVGGLTIQISLFRINWENYAVHARFLPSLSAPTSVKYSFPIKDKWASACTLTRSGNNLLHHGYYEEALFAYNRAIQQAQNAAEAYVGRAVAKYSLGWSREEVISDLSNALRILPSGQLARRIRQILKEF